MVKQPAQGRFHWRGLQRHTFFSGRKQHSQPKPASCGFNVAFNSRNLPGHKNTGAQPEREVIGKGYRGVHISIPVHASKADKLHFLQPLNHTENTFLLRVGKFGLAAHQIERGSVYIFRAQLHNGERPLARVGIDEAHRLERPEGQGHGAAFRHGLNRHAPLKMYFFFKIPGRSFFTRQQGFAKTMILLFRERAIQIVCIFGKVAGPQKRLFHIHRIGGNNGSDGVIKIKMFFTKNFCDFPA